MDKRRCLLKSLCVPTVSGMLASLIVGCAMVPPKSFLDPTTVGMFPLEYREGGIRRVLTPREGPTGLANATEPTPDDLVAVFEDYRIGPLDGVQMFIDDFYRAGFPYSAVQEVSPTGYINLPQLGLIKVVGMTDHELEQELRMRVQEAGLLPDPIIQVVVSTRRSQYFSVIGLVSRAGAYPLTQPDTRLLDVIGIVGDIGAQAKTIYIIRRENQGNASDVNDAYVPAEPESELIIPPPSDDDDSFESTLFAGSGGAAPVFPQVVVEDNPAAQEFEDIVAPRGQATQPATTQTTRPAERRFEPLVFDPETGELKEMAATPGARRDKSPAMREDKSEYVVEDRSPTPEPANVSDDFEWEDIPEFELSQRVIEIDVAALKSGDPRYNIIVRNRDVIRVPVDTGVYYMMGEVNRPGVFAFNGREITIKQAIATVGGFARLAWPSRCEIIRREKGTDKQITIPVNLDHVFAGLEDDVLLRDDDIVNVGTDIVAPFLFVIRNSFRFTYGFGFVYDRNFADKDAYGSQINPETLRIQRRQSLGLPF